VSAPAATATARAAPSSVAHAGFFADLPGGEDLDVPLDDAFAPGPAPSAPPSSGPWPLDAPGPEKAANALRAALAGDLAAAGAAGAAAVVQALSPLEQAVLAGEPIDFDPEPIRRAAVMRVRVAAALSSAPAPGAAVDPGAVSALLAEIDALLSEVNALAAGRPAEAAAPLEAVRNALVREAIDFSEAAQRAGPAAGAGAAALPARAPRAAAQARVVSVDSREEQDLEAAQDRRRRRMLVVFAASVLFAAAFHGYGWWKRAQVPDATPTRAGLPAGATWSAPPTEAAPAVVRAKDNAPFSPEERERLEREEVVRGNTVREVEPGVIVILPGQAAPPPPPGTAGR
jgi:hypothetical protein